MDMVSQGILGMLKYMNCNHSQQNHSCSKSDVETLCVKESPEGLHDIDSSVPEGL